MRTESSASTDTPVHVVDCHDKVLLMDNGSNQGRGKSYDVVTPAFDLGFNLARVFSETSRQLAIFHRAVREGKGVTEASVFCRWLRFSGILEILEAYPCSLVPRVVDGKTLRRQVEDVLYDCGEKFRTGKADPTYAASDIAEINRKLDVIAAHVGKFASPTNQTPEVDVAKTPTLSVIDGGAQ